MMINRGTWVVRAKARTTDSKHREELAKAVSRVDNMLVASRANRVDRAN
jgi:hypothetical protein